jgi:hypothetical protein
MPQEWSSATVNSLPVEVRRRQAGSIALVESVLQKSNFPIGEKRYGIVSGYPAVAENLPGGAFKVTINSLAVRSAAMPIGNEAEVSYDDAPTDQFGRNARLSNTFKEFARDTLGRIRITEMGPKAGYLGATGIYPDDFPHRPSAGRRRVPPYQRTRYEAGRPNVADHPGRSCGDAHSGQTHDDWAQGEEEEELKEQRQRTRILESREAERHESRLAEIEQRYYDGQLPHYGMMSRCSQVHPGATHSTWRSS